MEPPGSGWLKAGMATHQVLEKLEQALDAEGVTDPDFRELARVTLGKVLIKAHDQRPARDGGGDGGAVPRASERRKG